MPEISYAMAMPRHDNHCARHIMLMFAMREVFAFMLAR